jgi:hypothetical protein
MRGLLGSPEIRESAGGGTKGSVPKSEMYADGPSMGARKSSVPEVVFLSERSGTVRERESSVRRLRGKDVKRKTEVRIRILYER